MKSTPSTAAQKQPETAAVKPFDELTPHQQLLVAALEPDDEARKAWAAKRQNGAADSDLESFIVFVLKEMQDGEEHCQNEAGVIWWEASMNEPWIYFGAEDPASDLRNPDLEGKQLLHAVRELYGIEKPRRRSVKKRKKPAAGGSTSEATESLDVPVSSVVVVQNDREVFDQAELKRLADDIKARGIDNPLMVVPNPEAVGTYHLVAGERRLRAAKLAKLKTVPVRVRHDLDEKGIAIARLQENLQRVDLNPAEKAKGVQALIDSHDLKQKDAAELLGCSQGQVSNMLRMARLPDCMISAVSAGEVTATVARDAIPWLEHLADHEELVAKALADLRKDKWNAPPWADHTLTHAVGQQLRESKEFRSISTWNAPFNLTKKRRERLECFQLSSHGDWWTSSVELYEELAAAQAEKDKDKPKGSSSSRTSTAQLSPAEQKRKAAAAFKAKVENYATRWLHERVKGHLQANELTADQGVRLLLHFACTHTSGSLRTNFGSSLGSIIRRHGGKACGTGGWNGVQALKSLGTVPDEKVRLIAAEWLNEVTAHDPLYSYASFDAIAVRACASMLGIDWSTWRVDEGFLKLHTMELLLKQVKAWKLKAPAAKIAKKRMLIDWVLEQDSEEAPLAAPKALTG